MLIKKRSTLTGVVNEIDINISEEQYQKFIRGGDLDIIAPDLMEHERLFLLTGCLPDEDIEDNEDDFVPIRGGRHDNWDD